VSLHSGDFCVCAIKNWEGTGKFGENMVTFRILLMERERIVAEDIKRKLLKIRTIEIIMVNSWDRALEMLKSRDPNMMISEMNIDPFVSWEAAAREIRSLSMVPILFTACHSIPSLNERPDKYGDIDFLQKPLDIPLLKAMILAIMRGSERGTITQEECGEWNNESKSGMSFGRNSTGKRGKREKSGGLNNESMRELNGEWNKYHSKGTSSMRLYSMIEGGNNIEQ